MKRRRSPMPSVSFFAFQDIITAVVGIFILITLMLVLELAERVEAASADDGASEDLRPIFEAIETLEDEVLRLEADYAEQMRVRQTTSKINRFNAEEELEKIKEQVARGQIRLNQLQSDNARMEESSAQAEKDQVALSQERNELRKQEDLLKELAEKMRALQSRMNQLETSDDEIYRDVLEDGRYLTIVELITSEIIVHDALTRTVISMRSTNRIREFELWLRQNGSRSRHMMVMIKPGGAFDWLGIQELLESTNSSYGYTVVGEDYSARLGFELDSP